MHNDTPLGLSMRFKELDRQAFPQARSLRPEVQPTWRIAAVSAAASALLKRIRDAARRRRIVEGQVGDTRAMLRL
jgi:hypothetical protein